VSEKPKDSPYMYKTHIDIASSCATVAMNDLTQAVVPSMANADAIEHDMLQPAWPM
jgi:hypothetical protein